MTNTRILLSETGQHDVLEIVEETIPQPASREIRVRVEMSGIAFADVLARRGMYPTAPRKPYTPGYDIVGRVDALGEGITDYQIGDRVAGLLPHFGGNADYVCVPAHELVPAPADLPAEKVVAMILNYLTAHRLLNVNTNLQSGQRILIHSAAGGVGTALMQLGHLKGLEMYGTTSAGKFEIVRAHGATPIDYRTEDFEPRVVALTGYGVDAVFDPVGGETLKKSYRVLRPGGVVVSYGFMAGIDGGVSLVLGSMLRIALSQLFPRQDRKIIIYGDTPSIARKDVAWYRQTLVELFNLLVEGNIDPVVGEVLPLAEIARGHQLLESGGVCGKIVLVSG